jgi:hypothetical protein
MKVIPVTYPMKVIPGTYLMKVIPGTYLMKVIPGTYLHRYGHNDELDHLSVVLYMDYRSLHLEPDK